MKNSWNKEPYAIRRMLTETSVRASDRRVAFVGIDAYEAAGGAVLRDLFQGDDLIGPAQQRVEFGLPAHVHVQGGDLADEYLAPRFPDLELVKIVTLASEIARAIESVATNNGPSRSELEAIDVEDMDDGIHDFDVTTDYTELVCERHPHGWIGFKHSGAYIAKFYVAIWLGSIIVRRRDGETRSPVPVMLLGLVIQRTLETSEGEWRSVLYADPSADLTARVIERLNEKHSQEKK